jgi:hypothetical protein
MKFRNLQGSLTWEKFFMTVVDFSGSFFLQNDVSKLQEVFLELEIKVFEENRLESFQTFFIL